MKRWAIAAGIVIAWALIAGGMDRRDAEITAAIKRETDERVITFTFPLEYTATATQCDIKRECRTRYYNPRSK